MPSVKCEEGRIILRRHLFPLERSIWNDGIVELESVSVLSTRLGWTCGADEVHAEHVLAALFMTQLLSY